MAPWHGIATFDLCVMNFRTGVNTAGQGSMHVWSGMHEHRSALRAAISLSSSVAFANLRPHRHARFQWLPCDDCKVAVRSCRLCMSQQYAPQFEQTPTVEASVQKLLCSVHECAAELEASPEAGRKLPRLPASEMQALGIIIQSPVLPENEDFDAERVVDHQHWLDQMSSPGNPDPDQEDRAAVAAK